MCTRVIVHALCMYESFWRSEESLGSLVLTLQMVVCWLALTSSSREEVKRHSVLWATMNGKGERRYSVHCTDVTGVYGSPSPCKVEVRREHGVSGTDITDGCGPPWELWEWIQALLNSTCWDIFPSHFFLLMSMLFWHMKVSCCYFLWWAEAFFCKLFCKSGVEDAMFSHHPNSQSD